MTNIDALMRAISLTDGQAPLARACGVKPQSVNDWINKACVPADRVIAVATATGWQVTPHDLRPDIYPNPTDGLPADHPVRIPSATPEPQQAAA